MKALELLKTNRTVQERAETYANSIKRDIQKEVLDTLIEKKEKLEDRLYELKNFTLDTDVNKGLAQMTKEDCKRRFMEIIESEYQLTLITAELKVKQESFNKYFADESKE